MYLPSRITRAETWVALAAGLIVASPALALPFELPFTGNGLPLRDWVLMGSLVLLAVALAVKLLRRGDRHAATSDGPDMHDMRWWRNQ